VLAHPKLLPELVKLLGDRNLIVAYGANIVLGNIAPTVDITIALPKLTELLSFKKPDRMVYFIHHDNITTLALATKNIKTRDAVLKLLIDKLSDKNPLVRENATKALGNTALAEVDNSIAVPHLTKRLKDRNNSVKYAAAVALGYTGQMGTNISIAIPKLTDLLRSKKRYARMGASSAFALSAGHGNDISIAIPALVGCLTDVLVRFDACTALTELAKTGDDKTLEAIVAEIYSFMESKLFGRELGLNSKIFVDTIDQICILMRIIQARYREAA
ncbi:MAG: HEAT repeat domain-containing protein, partial [Candidatus Micrarchaeota archaeon]|nr:HEAT repeat domain-containing protein [Candidatus Micrarchaeota archaeon]